MLAKIAARNSFFPEFWEVKKNNSTKLRVIIEARENKGFVCTEEVWGYCTLTNEINAGGYLYLSWYSKGNLGLVCLVAD